MSNINILKPIPLRQRFKLETFVETGCYQGESLGLAAASGFMKLVTCDVNGDFVARCRAQFPGAVVVHGNSTTLLGQFLPCLPEAARPTLFWLDAHFPAYYGAAETSETRFPLLDELELIRAHKPGWEHDVIAIDDLRVIRDPRNPRYQPGELRGKESLLYQDLTLAQLYLPFAATHSLQLIHECEGVAALLPYS